MVAMTETRVGVWIGEHWRCGSPDCVFPVHREDATCHRCGVLRPPYPSAPVATRKREFTVKCVPPTATNNGCWRVADPDDNRIATCYLPENAKRIVDALNATLVSRAAPDGDAGELSEGQEERIADQLHLSLNQVREVLALARSSGDALAKAKAEGAREALTKLGVRADEGLLKFTIDGAMVRLFRDREYPAPAAPERECVTLPTSGDVVTLEYASASLSAFHRRGKDGRHWNSLTWLELFTASDTGADFDALKAFALALATAKEGASHE